MRFCEICGSPITLDLEIGKEVCIYCGAMFPIEYYTYGIPISEKKEGDEE